MTDRFNIGDIIMNHDYCNVAIIINHSYNIVRISNNKPKIEWTPIVIKIKYE